MEKQAIVNGAQKIFDALNQDGFVIANNMPVEAVRIKKGRLVGYMFGDKKSIAIDLTDKEVCSYQKLDALYTPPTGVETSTEVASA